MILVSFISLEKKKINYRATETIREFIKRRKNINGIKWSGALFYIYTALELARQGTVDSALSPRKSIFSFFFTLNSFLNT